MVAAVLVTIVAVTASAAPRDMLRSLTQLRDRYVSTSNQHRGEKSRHVLSCCLT